jgi:hypothetical protein
MDVFLIVGLPFGLFLVAFAWAGYSIGGSAAGPDGTPPPPGGRRRLGRSGLIAGAAVVTALGAGAAGSAGAFARTTNTGYPVEPTALLLALEAVADLALVAVVALPGWSSRRAWTLRMVAVYWLCLALPAWILADAGPDWLSTDPARAILMLGFPAFVWEALALVVPAILVLFASRATSRPPLPPLTGDLPVT